MYDKCFTYKVFVYAKKLFCVERSPGKTQRLHNQFIIKLACYRKIKSMASKLGAQMEEAAENTFS